MNSLEYLNTFLTERLMTVAGEIFQVFKDTVTEYQGEIERIRHENRCLRETLAEIDGNIAQQRQGAQMIDADGDQHNSNQGPLDSEHSLIQVKLEFATLEQECEPQQASSEPQMYTSNVAKAIHGPVPTQCFSDKTVVLDDMEDNSLHTNSAVTVKVEPCASHAIYSDSTSTAEILNDAATDQARLGQDSYCGRAFDEVSHLASHLQSHVDMFSCEVCGKSFKKKGTLKTHMIVHQKERPYRCRLCGKSYSCAKVLNVHLISHTVLFSPLQTLL
ncbi:zinc finger protein 85-like isoform X2 [Electrophorus electricus]|uniref:zinc finger protein 85-like isoform X2 n=1 Tax=Electrophorus electricus TaxID=8005 RepID=UPI0015D09437|nr:zinc finger protein 85-like isoform X2 [Electrophorus electricus]